MGRDYSADPIAKQYAITYTNNALFESYSRLVQQEKIDAIYMPARREVLDFRDPNQVTTLLVKKFEELAVDDPGKMGRFYFYPLQKNFLSTETYGEPRRDMVVLGSRQDLEMQVLMSQINPHFLYNTLESIVWKAGGGRPPGHRQAGLLPGQAVPAEHLGRAVRPPGAGDGTRADVHEHPAQPLRQQGGL